MKSCLFEGVKLCFIGKDVANTDEIKINERKQKTKKKEKCKWKLSHLWWLTPRIALEAGARGIAGAWGPQGFQRKNRLCPSKNRDKREYMKMMNNLIDYTDKDTFVLIFWRQQRGVEWRSVLPKSYSRLERAWRSNHHHQNYKNPAMTP